VPSNPFCDNVLKVFNNEEKSDVVFIVGGEVESAANRRKRAKTAATRFYASRVILDVNAPSLADMCRPGDEAAVPINGVEPEVFKMVLYFCYGGAITVEELAAKAKEIIEAADRFGIVNLKLQAEAVLTEQTEVTVDNMLDNLLYANSKNLALFLEKIMDFVAENGSMLLGKVSFDDVPSNLISDILTAVAQGKKSAGGVAGDDLQILRVVNDNDTPRSLLVSPYLFFSPLPLSPSHVIRRVPPKESRGRGLHEPALDPRPRVRQLLPAVVLDLLLPHPRLPLLVELGNPRPPLVGEVYPHPPALVDQVEDVGYVDRHVDGRHGRGEGDLRVRTGGRTGVRRTGRRGRRRGGRDAGRRRGPPGAVRGGAAGRRGGGGLAGPTLGGP
ncbi:hypothetical protein THAOC_05297, partial [Thalassiosira oceanica]